MKRFIRHPFGIFVLSAIAVCTLLLLVPINLFDSEVVIGTGWQRIVQPVKLNLGDYAGIWATREDMQGISDFYLVPKGWLMVFLMTVCFPALIAYRVWIAQNSHKNKKEN